MAFIAAMDTTITENGALAYASTRNPFLDLFFQLVRTTTAEQIKNMVSNVFTYETFEHAGKTYNNLDFFNRMVMYTRNVRGGVGERDLSYYMFMSIMANNDFDSMRRLMKHFAHFGYWKDYINLYKKIEEDTVFGIDGVMKKAYTRDMVNIYCEQLKKDYTDLIKTKSSSESEKSPSISLAAKWMPSDRDAIDKKYHLLDKFAWKMAELMEWKVDNSKTYHVREMLRKQIIAPLRKAIKLVEIDMCARQWDNINYEGVPSNAMNRYKKAFAKRDEERFAKYKAGLISGEKKVNFETVYPHEIMREYVYGRKNLDEVSEAQMNGWRDKLMEMGKFGNSVSIVDVSGSMSGQPMEVAVALGCLFSSVANEPFRNATITFSENPTFFNLNDESWCDKIHKLMKAPWGMNTNFSAVFNLILNRAKEMELRQCDMPERLYVFSDMQFDQADSGYHTHYESIKKKYKDAGYELPQIIFWNLRASSSNSSYPATLINKNVALLSGFSPAIVKSVLDVSDLTPMGTMINAIMDKAYDNI